MLIELDMFSGRPNPRWSVDDRTEKELIETHHRLERTPAPTAEPPGLGYRGFRYALEGSDWRAWNGIVTGPASTLMDPGRSVERLLLARLPSTFKDVRAMLESEILSDR